MISSAKFMLPNSTDELFVSVKSFKEGVFNPDNVRFISSSGKEFKAANYDKAQKVWLLTVLGSEAGDGYSLYVVHKTGEEYATLAKLNIYSYEPKTVNLKLILVNEFTNGFNVENLTVELNKIYNKVGITCKVMIAPSFDYEPLKDKSLNMTGSGLFSVYTNEMKQLNTAYISENPDETGIILFVIKKASDGVLGDMPRGKQFGYLFGGSTAQTIAHEIGHGLFKLDHPFDRANAAKSFTKGDLKDNLMEYYGVLIL